MRGPTFLLVHTQHDDDLVAADTDQLLDTSDTTSRKLGKKNHAVDVVVLEELDISSHIGDLATVSAGKRQTTTFGDRTCLTFTITKESISGYFSS
jgi:hypothetical protein